MFLVLLRREILAHLITFRFAVAVIACLLLVIITTLIRIEITRNDWQVTIPPDANRNFCPPEPFPFNGRSSPESVEHFHGMEEGIHCESITPLFSGMRKLTVRYFHRSLLSNLSRFYSVCAFITGTAVRLRQLRGNVGTMRLTMSHSVRRGSILAAKYLGAMACLIIPLIISFTIALIWMVSSGSIVFSGDDYLRIACVLLTSYLSAIYLIGLFISTSVHRTATALMLSLFVWVVLVLVYPSLSVSVVDQLTKPKRSEINSSYAMRQIRLAVNKEEIEYLENDGVEGNSDRFNLKGLLYAMSVLGTSRH